MEKLPLKVISTQILYRWNPSGSTSKVRRKCTDDPSSHLSLRPRVHVGNDCFVGAGFLHEEARPLAGHPTRGPGRFRVALVPETSQKRSRSLHATAHPMAISWSAACRSL